MPFLFLAAVWAVGAIVALAWLGPRNVLWVYAAAPVSVVVVVALGLLQVFWHFTFGWVPVLVVAAGLALLGVVWRRAAARGRPAAGERAAASPGTWWALATLVTTALAALATLWLAGGHTLALMSQTWDAIFDCNAIRWVHDSGDAAPTRLVAFSYGTARPGGYYPSAFHALGALSMAAGGWDAITASNVTAALVAGVLWPSAVALGTALVFGTGRHLPTIAAVLCIGFTGMPWAPMGWGVLWATALAACFVPIAVGGLARLVDVARRDRRLDLTGAAAFAVGFVLVALCHPRIGTILSVLILGLAHVYLGRWLVGRLRARAVVPVVAALAGLVVFWAAAALFILRFRRGDSQYGVRGWEVERGRLAEVAGYLLNGPNGAVPLLLTAVALAVGVVAVVRSRGRRGEVLVILLAGAVALDILTATTRGFTPWNGIARFWYTDRHRTITLPPAMAVPLAAFGARLLWDRVAQRRSTGRRAGRAIASLLVATLVGTGVWAGTVLLRKSYSVAVADPYESLLTLREEAFYRKAATFMPKDARVLNNANDGSALLYAVTGIKPVFLVAGVVGSTPNAEWLRSQGVTLESSNFCYLTSQDRIGWILDSGRAYSAGVINEMSAPNLRIPPGYFATTEVLRDEELVLYQITGCPKG